MLRIYSRLAVGDQNTQAVRKMPESLLNGEGCGHLARFILTLPGIRECRMGYEGSSDMGLGKCDKVSTLLSKAYALSRSTPNLKQQMLNLGEQKE